MGINVVSLFDGMGGFQMALKRAGIPIENYFASEVNKYALQVTKKLFPMNMQIGDVTKIPDDYFKDINIDILCGGSPCLDLSFSGKKRGLAAVGKIEITTLEQYLKLKEDGFEFIGQSYLFWEYIRLLKAIKPRYYILENVKMAPKWREIMSDAIGTEPILLDSALVSAQSRKRNYWTNIPGTKDSLIGKMIEPPKDKGIKLLDILEQDAEEPMLSNIYGGFGEKKPRVHYGKSVTIRTATGGGHLPSVTLKPKLLGNVNPSGNGMNGRVFDIEGDKAPAVTGNKGEGSKIGYGDCADFNPVRKKNYIQYDIRGKGHGSQDQRAYYKDGKHGTLPATGGESKAKVLLDNKTKWRKITPLEAERLQTVNDNATAFGIDEAGNDVKISNSQRFFLIGNGFTIDMITHLLKGFQYEKDSPKFKIGHIVRSHLYASPVLGTVVKIDKTAVTIEPLGHHGLEYNMNMEHLEIIGELYVNEKRTRE